MPKKICLGSRCNNLVEMKDRYCPSCAKGKAIEKQEHNKKYDQLVRDPKIVKFYHSRPWKITREYILVRDNFLCQHCLKMDPPQITSAELVHHIIELKEDWSMRIATTNLVSVCKACHNAIDHKY